MEEEDSDSLEELSEAVSSKSILEQGTKSLRYRLSFEEVDALLGVIYETLEIKEEQVSLSIHNQMYQTLKEDQGRVFPVHDALSESIKKKWMELDKKLFFPKSLKSSKVGRSIFSMC